MNFIRGVVSGKRNRFRDDGFDLDLSYITPRIAAMGFPASGLEGTYRNHIDDVARFLRSRHGDSYMVFNLSERHYDAGLFGHRVLELGFPDHHAPPVEVAWAVCRTIDGWLSAAADNVAIVHCLAGKGRTGVIIACYLLFAGHLFKRYLRDSSVVPALQRGGGGGGGAYDGGGDDEDIGQYPVAELPPQLGGASARAAGAPQPPSTAAGATSPSSLRASSPRSPGGGGPAAANSGGGGGGGGLVAARLMGLAAVAERAASKAASAASAAVATASLRMGGGGGAPPPPSPAPAPGGGGRAALDSMASASAAVASRTAHFPLPPPSEMARDVLALFRARRGEGVKYPSQERIVRYFARVVHDALLAEHFMLHQADAAGVPAARGDVPAVEPVAARRRDAEPAGGSSRGSGGGAQPPAAVVMDDARMAKLQAMMDLLMAPPVVGGGGGSGAGGGGLPDFAARTVLVRTATLHELRRLKQLPLPRRVPVLLTRVVLRGVPNVPGGIFSPLLHVSTAPYQGATTRVIYSSAWTHPVPLCYPSAPAAGAGAGTVAFPMAARITGDILLACTALSVAPGAPVAIGGHPQVGAGAASGGGLAPPAGAGASGASTVGGNAALSGAPSSAALFRFSFHTAFMLGDVAAAALGGVGARGASGPGGGGGGGGGSGGACVYRLPLADLDIEHRKKNEELFPCGFAVELHFTFDAAAAPAPAAAAGGARALSTELELPPIRPLAALVAAPAAPDGGGSGGGGDGSGSQARVVDELAATLALQSFSGIASGGEDAPSGAAATADGGDDDDDDEAASLDGSAASVVDDEPLLDPALHGHAAAPPPLPLRTVGLHHHSHSGTPVPVVLLHAGMRGEVGAYGGGGGGGLSGSGHLEHGGSGDVDVVALGNLAKAGGVLGTAWRRRFCVLQRMPQAPMLLPEGGAHPPSLASAVAGAAVAAGPSAVGAAGAPAAAPPAFTGSAALQVTLGTLHYFASSRDAAPRGSLPLSLASLRRTRVTWPLGHPAAAAAGDTDDHDAGEEGGGGAAAAPGGGGGVGTAGGRDRPFTIALRSRGRRFFFQAADEDDLRRWLAALAALVPAGEAPPPQLRPGREMMAIATLRRVVG